MSTEDDLAAQIEEAEAELTALAQARERALERLAALRAAGSATNAPPQLRLPIGDGRKAPRTGDEKVRLFRSLFRGRTDVFPKRWENAKQERSGYAPACANEWVRGVCEKPKVRCGECPNQAFITVDDRVIADHLSGKYTAGVYPLLHDDTCWFVALDFDEASWMDDVAPSSRPVKATGSPRLSSDRGPETERMSGSSSRRPYPRVMPETWHRFC